MGNRTNALVWIARGVVAFAVIGGSVVVGAQLREFRSPAAAAPSASATQRVGDGRPSATTGIVGPALTAPPSTTPYSKPTPIPTPAPSVGPAGVVTGRVTAFGKPVAGADIRVYADDQFAHGPTPVPPMRGDAKTGADGTYRVTLPGGSYKIGAYVDEAAAAASGYWWVTWYGDAYAIGLAKPIVVSGDVHGVDIAMLRAVAISGRVTGRDGIPVPGAPVLAQRQVGTIGFILASGVTDASGAFTLRTAPMTMTITVEVSGTSGATSASQAVDVTGDVTGLTLQLDRGNVVSGVLRDASGAPLADTNFGVLLAGTNTPCAYSCTGRTDATGRYAVTLPNATLHFATWTPQGAIRLASKDYVISGDLTVDPVLSTP